MNELGAKKDVYTAARCMSSGVLLGRMAAGLASFKRALENPHAWSPAYAVGLAVRPAYEAADALDRFLPTVRPETKAFMENLASYKDSSSFGFNKEDAAKKLAAAEGHLDKIAQIAVNKCGKRRPEEGEGKALLVMKHVKRAPRPKSAAPEQMVLPVIVEPEKPAEAGTPWGLIAGVALIIGTAFLMR